MLRFHTTITMLVASVATAAVVVHANENVAALHAQLERVAQRRIFFAHQSVGMNVLDGVKTLAQDASVPLRIVERQASGNADHAALEHMFVPENGKPLDKLRNFDAALNAGHANVDIAVFKFCYTDIDAQTDVKMLFERYRSTIDRLKQEHPNATFVHVTVPLTTVQSGWKALLKRLLGRAPYGVLENRRREEYNALLRKTYEGKEPVFDLARIESTAPDGRRETSEWQGKNVPALNAAYTDDGSHLNAAGRVRAAREFIVVLSAIRSGHDHVR